MNLSPKPVVVGIDGGGSHVRAVAMLGDQVIFRGEGGPGNPLATEHATLVQSYQDALHGCPPPERIGACVAGAGGGVGRDCLTRLLVELVPDASVVVGADYLAALHGPGDYDLWVIAGTGSIVFSCVDQAVVTSGGRGWQLGDQGSAARLGRALLEAYVEDPEVDVTLAAEVNAIAGTKEWRDIVHRVQYGSSPAAWLGQFAPILTARAESGEGWALTLIKAELSALASTAARHVRRHSVEATNPVSVCLVGGVWRSTVTADVFRDHLERLLGCVELAIPNLDLAVGAASYAGRAS
jgi:N-acetylglucosamine kinase-like BadF-type ATPase